MKSSFINLTILFIILIVLGFLYRKFEDKRIKKEEKNDYKTIQDYLLTTPSPLVDDKDKRPVMWIHVPYEYNSRNWISFGSRSSMDLNQPYLYLTVKSIINQCKDTFRIVIIDDSSFEKIIPDWSINMKKISHPISNNVRSLAMAKILYVYGGIIVPISFLCTRNLIDMYNRGITDGKMFVCENIDRNITSSMYDFYPDIRFMGAIKENETIGGLVEYMQRKISNDFTEQSIFLGDFNHWIYNQIKKNKALLIDGKDVGVKNMEDQPILLEDLLSENYIDFYSDMYGIWIPASDILKMRKYEWFSRLSARQVLEANTMLSKYILVANAPDANTNGVGVIEPMTAKPDWVKFWMMPNQEPYWGLMPNAQYGGLGDNLIGSKEMFSYT